MKNIIKIIIALSLTISLNASVSNMYSTNKTLEPVNEQREVIAKKDYNELLKALHSAYDMGDKSKSFIIASMYAKEYSLNDGVIKPNIKKAIHYYKQALNAGVGLASIQLAFLDLIPNNRIFEALDLMEDSMNAKLNNNSAKASISLAYAGIVLEQLNENIKYIRKATELLYPHALRNNLSSLDYALANLLNLVGETKEANKFLNSACNNPNVPREILYMCINGSEIKGVDTITGKQIKKDTNLGCMNAQNNY